MQELYLDCSQKSARWTWGDVSCITLLQQKIILIIVCKMYGKAICVVCEAVFNMGIVKCSTTVQLVGLE